MSQQPEFAAEIAEREATFAAQRAAQQDDEQDYFEHVCAQLRRPPMTALVLEAWLGLID